MVLLEWSRDGESRGRASFRIGPELAILDFPPSPSPKRYRPCMIITWNVAIINVYKGSWCLRVGEVVC